MHLSKKVAALKKCLTIGYELMILALCNIIAAIMKLNGDKLSKDSK